MPQLLRNWASLPFRAGLLLTMALSSPALAPLGTESLTLRFIPYSLPPTMSSAPSEAQGIAASMT